MLALSLSAEAKYIVHLMSTDPLRL